MKKFSSDFFERQEQARKNTTRLVAVFGVAVIVLSLATYVALWVGYSMSGYELPLVDPMLFVVALVGTGAFIFIGSAYKISALGGGGNLVAEEMGGTEVDPSSSDPLVRRYVNIVEEMSLASGVPVPRTYVLADEPGINAFAAGYTMNDAAIAVTQGALEHFTRDELQAVVAHEYSHILNGDMRLNIRLIGVIHGILLMYLFGRILLRSMGRSRNSRGGGPILIAGLALVVFGYGGVICGRLIKAAVSRQREYLADAAAVQFTRNPNGLVGALKKIGAVSYGSSLQSAMAEEVSHMCFGRVREKPSFFGAMTATHPPLVKRIQAIDPSFGGDFSQVDMTNQRHLMAEATVRRAKSLAQERTQPEMAMAMAGVVSGMSAEVGYGGSDWRGRDRPGASTGGNDWSTADRELRYDLHATEVLDSVGDVSPEKLTYCATLLEEIPRSLMDARSSTLGAIATVYGLLLDANPEERKKQGALLEAHGDPRVVKECRRLWGAVSTLDGEYRLPLLDLLFPTLRRMTAQQFKNFSRMVERLIMADGTVNLKEFIIQKVLLHRLEMAFSGREQRAVQFKSFNAVARDIQNLLSCLAYVGHDDINEAMRSFGVGQARLPSKHMSKFTFLPREEWSYPAVDVSLDRLAHAGPTIKRAVVDACAHCVMGDGAITVEEAELLRAICESVDVPLPPFIPVATKKAL